MARVPHPNEDGLPWLCSRDGHLWDNMDRSNCLECYVHWNDAFVLRLERRPDGKTRTEV